MTFGIWLVGVFAFMIYDGIIGFEIENSGLLMYILYAVFWYISVPIFIFKHLKDKYK
jgi:hypothetical protein